MLLRAGGSSALAVLPLVAGVHSRGHDRKLGASQLAAKSRNPPPVRLDPRGARARRREGGGGRWRAGPEARGSALVPPLRRDTLGNQQAAMCEAGKVPVNDGEQKTGHRTNLPRSFARAYASRFLTRCRSAQSAQRRPSVGGFFAQSWHFVSSRMSSPWVELRGSIPRRHRPFQQSGALLGSQSATGRKRLWR